MWTPESRARYYRGGLRYPSDLSHEEWAVIAPLIPPGRAATGGAASMFGRFSRTYSTFWKPAASSQWRHLPQDLLPRSTCHSYLQLWAPTPALG